MTGLQKRVAMARGTYDRAGYTATSHHITTLGIEPVQGDSGRIKGHLQAWHVRRDGATVVGLGTWEVDVTRTPAFVLSIASLSQSSLGSWVLNKELNSLSVHLSP